MRHEALRLIARQDQDLGVADQVPDAEHRQARLFGAEKLAGPAQTQVHLGDMESVAGIHQRPDSLAPQVVQLLGDQHAIALLRTAAHAAAQLVDLRQPEALRIFDHHDRWRWARPRPPQSPSWRPAPAHRRAGMPPSRLPSRRTGACRAAARPSTAGNTCVERSSYAFCAAFIAMVSDSSMAG